MTDAPTCLWCGARFGRRSGGKPQRFCSEACRRSFARAALTWVEMAVATGELSRDTLRNSLPSNAALLSRGDASSGLNPTPGSPAVVCSGPREAQSRRGGLAVASNNRQ